MLFIFILDYRNGRQKANLSDFFKFKFIMGCKAAETAAAKSLQSYPTLQCHGLQPPRLLCPQDSPGKNTGVGCRFLLQSPPIFIEQNQETSKPHTIGLSCAEI